MATEATTAKRAVSALFQRLDRKSARDPSSAYGDRQPGGLSGDVELRDVVFAYPSRPAFLICNGFSLTIRAGQHAALVGPSGSGKSTVVSLLERFYDPHSGTVSLDGTEIKSLNIKWLRRQLALVGQEPVLFMGTVGENIAYGSPEGASQQEIEQAAAMANAHDFITKDLGDGYQTEVGLGGGKLSGGQKQRVAIARALIRKPSILLLDEATSALDGNSEKVVQAALDEIMNKQKRTTITIAHRLSTIRHADLIAVVSKGKVVEHGNWDSLCKVEGGFFASLAQQQPVAVSEDPISAVERSDQKAKPGFARHKFRVARAALALASSRSATTPGMLRAYKEEPSRPVAFSTGKGGEAEGGKAEATTLPPSTFLRLMAMQSAEDKKLIVVGALCAAVSGASMPVLGYAANQGTLRAAITDCIDSHRPPNAPHPRPLTAYSHPTLFAPRPTFPSPPRPLAPRPSHKGIVALFIQFLVRTTIL